MRTQSPFLQHLRWPSSPSPTHFFQSVDQHSSHLQSCLRPSDVSPPPPPFTLYTSQRSCFPVTPLHSRQPRYQGRDTIVRSLEKTSQLGCIIRTCTNLTTQISCDLNLIMTDHLQTNAAYFTSKLEEGWRGQCVVRAACEGVSVCVKIKSVGASRSYPMHK